MRKNQYFTNIGTLPHHILVLSISIALILPNHLNVLMKFCEINGNIEIPKIKKQNVVTIY